MSLPKQFRHASESWHLGLLAQDCAALDPSFRWGDEGEVE
jgi:hypothetical protein